MVLKNHTDRKTGENQGEKAYKIKGKRLVSIGKGYHDLSSSDEMGLKNKHLCGFQTN